MTQLDQATITIDLGKLEENTRGVVEALGAGVDVVTVTKATAGSPEVARAMLAGGAAALAESRLENITRMRGAGVDTTFWLLRAAPPAAAAETVRLADISLASELDSVAALGAAAREAGMVHAIIAMVDLGDLREGMMPEELPAFLDTAARVPGIEIAGIGVNLACYGGVEPSADNLGRLAELAEWAERRLGKKLIVSGGNSSSIELAVREGMPAAVNNLRIGESVLLGVSVLTREPILGLHRDAFIASAPLIECKVKPSMPIGTIAQDAFGNTPEFIDRGLRRRAICAIGRQDAPPAGLRPVDPRIEVLGASSDHLILDVENLPETPAIGEAIEFVPNYAALVGLFTSPYVRKVYTGSAGG
jgi:predicted amino acid racemase